jgi:hypothetical protein
LSDWALPPIRQALQIFPAHRVSWILEIQGQNVLKTFLITSQK